MHWNLMYFQTILFAEVVIVHVINFQEFIIYCVTCCSPCMYFLCLLLVSNSRSTEKYKIPGNPTDIQTKERTDPLDDLAALGSSLIKQNLPSNVPIQVQFKPVEKLSMNQMKQQQQQQQQSATSQTSTMSSNTTSVQPSKSTPVGSVSALQFSPAVSPASADNASGDTVDSLLNVNLLSGDKSANAMTNEMAPTPDAKDKVNLLEDSGLLDSDSLIEAPSPPSAVLETSNTTSKPSRNPGKSESQDRKRTSSTSNPQFMEVKPMTDLKVTLDSIKPGKE